MTTVTHADSSAFGGALGGIINVVANSGTNSLHGSVWEYWRASRFLDASSPITQTLSDLHQHQFGVSIGGPVLIPHLYHGRNKAFFYGRYEGFRQTTGATQLALVYKTWNPSGFDAANWISTFKDSGMKMFAFTSKHHEGFSMFNTKTRVKNRTNWTSLGGPRIENCDLAYSIMETPFRRDVVKELCDEAHKQGIKIDLYFSHPD